MREEDIYRLVLIDEASIFDLLVDILELFLVIPCSNAEIERGFSCMARIKTDIRNRLLTETLDYLMNISNNGAKIGEYNPKDDNLFWKINYRKYFLL